MLFDHKIFKSVLLVVASLFIIISVGIILLVNLVDPNKYKPFIIASVNDSTGRKLHLDGKISWQIWPNIGLQIKQVSLSNPEGWESSNFIEMQSASVSLNLLPLFRSKIVINDMRINGLKLNLIQANNKNNWTFNPVNQQAKTHESSAVGFALHSFSIVNSDITYSNFANKTSTAIKNLNFSLDTPADGSIRFNSKTGQLNLDSVNFNLDNLLKGKIQLALHKQPQILYTGNISLAQFSLNKLLTKFNEKPINIKNKAILDAVSLKTSFEGNDKSLNLPDLGINVGPTILKGNVQVKNFSPMLIQNYVNIKELDVADWIDAKGYKIPTHDINLRGTLTNADLGIRKIFAQQHLTAKDIMLYGINIQHTIAYAAKTLTVDQFANPVKLFERLNTLLSPAAYKKVDLNQKTDLGRLETNIVLHKGILDTPGFLLSGPTLRVTSSGMANFNNNSINYTAYTKLVSIPANSLLGSLTYPYTIKGKLSNPNTSVDGISLQKQIIDYYASIGRASGVVNKVKQGTAHLWNKIFH